MRVDDDSSLRADRRDAHKGPLTTTNRDTVRAFVGDFIAGILYPSLDFGDVQIRQLAELV